MGQEESNFSSKQKWKFAERSYHDLTKLSFTLYSRRMKQKTFWVDCCLETWLLVSSELHIIVETTRRLKWTFLNLISETPKMSTSQSMQVKANTKGTTIKLIYHRIEPSQTYNNIIKCCYIILFFCNIVFFFKAHKITILQIWEMPRHWHFL